MEDEWGPGPGSRGAVGLRQVTPALWVCLPWDMERKVLCELPRAEQRLPSSLDHGQHPRHQLPLNGGVCSLGVLGLQDDLMGLLEEDLPHCRLHALVPRSQLGSAFKDSAAGTHRL